MPWGALTLGLLLMLQITEKPVATGKTGNTEASFQVELQLQN